MKSNMLFITKIFNTIYHWGIKLVKVHRILKSKQSNWLKVYVEFDTKKRQESTDEFNKNFFKLLINCVYSKSMGNIRKRINFRLINDSKEYLNM